MKRPVRVLHVDDEPGLAELTAEFLVRESDRFEPTPVSSVEDAHGHLETNAVDCIVSDYDMPGQNGIEFLQVVRATDPDLPFILFTGKGSEEIASDAISAGVTDYLQKETGRSQYTVLANRISNAVEQHRARQQLAEDEQRLAVFFEESPLGMIEWTADFEIKRLNETAADILGYTEDELVGESWRTLVPEEQQAAIADAIEDILADRGGYQGINDNLRKDGTRITCEWHNRIIVEDGEFVASFSKFHDITDRVEREWKLSGMRDCAKALMHTETRTETAAVATRAADELIGARLSSVQLRSEDGAFLESAALTDTGEATFELPLRYPRDTEPGSRSALVWGVFTSGEPLHIGDMDAYGPLTEGTPAGSAILHPLDDHGVFIISATEPHAFDETDEVLVDVLGNFLTTALDRVDREQRLRERQQRLERLHEATRTIMAASTVEAVAEAAVHAAETILDFQISLVRRYDPETDALVPIAATDLVGELLPERTPFTRDHGSENWDVYVSGEGQVYDDVHALDGAVDAGTALRSLLVLPLGSFGTFSTGKTTPGAFDESDVFLARILATTTETALARTEQEHDLRVQRDVLEGRERTLRAMHDVIADHERPFEDQVQALLDLGRRELDVRYGTLSRIDGDDYHFEVVSSADDSIQAGDVAPLSATNCEVAAATEQTLVLGDVERDAPTETHRAGFTDWGISCYVGAPVYSGSDIYGTFCFYDTTPRPGQFSDWEVTLVDLMSRWVSAERHRQETTAQLNREHERLERFASVVSHDLRNPLTVLQGRLQLAEETDDQAQFEHCYAAIDRMESLIESLLDLARAGEVIAPSTLVELDTLAETCWATVDTADATLVLESTRQVRCDETRMKQLLENLFTNAIEHGGNHVTITVGDLPSGFYVEDDGPGIASADLETVFDSGYSTNPEGTGLGLSIVHEIATAHGWTVTATTGSAGGARFEFTDVPDATEESATA